MISEQSPYSGGPQVIPVITWTCSPDLPGNRSLFPGNVPGNVPVGCSGCRPLSYFRIFYGSRSIVEYITILYYRRLLELYRCFRISTHYSDPPYRVGSNRHERQVQVRCGTRVLGYYIAAPRYRGTELQVLSEFCRLNYKACLSCSRSLT